MGFKVLGSAEQLYRGYGPRKGLEGPFCFAGDRILYYDPKQGQYWDPLTDFYVDNDEMARIHAELMRTLAG